MRSHWAQADIPAWNQVDPLPVLFGESVSFLLVFGGVGRAMTGVAAARTAALTRTGMHSRRPPAGCARPPGAENPEDNV
jgi:hypothetical protein